MPIIRLHRESPLFLDTRQFILDCQARNLSPATIRIYCDALRCFQEFLQESRLVVSSKTIREFLVEYSETHNPGGVHGVYRVLKTFFRWLQREDNVDNPMLRVRSPRVPQQVLSPVSLEDVGAMLRTCTAAARLGSTCTAKSYTDVRDKAILLCLLSTGCRASEFVSLDVEDVDLDTGIVAVRHDSASFFL